MKKLIIASIALFLVATTSVNAQTVPAPAATETTEQEKTPIKVEDLPETVKAAIAADDYKGWEVKSAFVVKGEIETYEINFIKGEETNSVKFDKEGKKLG